MNAVSPESEHMLVEIGTRAPLRWHGPVWSAAEAGDLCTAGTNALTIWAPAGAWWSAFCLVAMCVSASPGRCLVLTDELPPLDRVPFDARVAAVARGCPGPSVGGRAPFTCADMRSDRVFRLLLSECSGSRQELEPLLRNHLLARTRRGGEILERWHDTLLVVLSAGLDGGMRDDLRADLENLAAVALRGFHAAMGGFHALDPVVRGPDEWEKGARKYLPLAAASVPTTLAAVRRWLDSTAGWDLASPACQEELRLTAARLLHRLVDDPWSDLAQCDPVRRP